MKQFTAEEKTVYKAAKAEEANEYMEIVMQGVMDLKNSDAYKAYLDTATQFHHYSVHNLVMISQQKPDASQITSFATWKKLRRQCEERRNRCQDLGTACEELDSKSS